MYSCIQILIISEFFVEIYIFKYFHMVIYMLSKNWKNNFFPKIAHWTATVGIGVGQASVGLMLGYITYNVTLWFSVLSFVCEYFIKVITCVMCKPFQLISILKYTKALSRISAKVKIRRSILLLCWHSRKVIELNLFESDTLLRMHTK